MAIGRFAPSPTGPLHVGNLRTALLAWLFARSTGSAFLVRVEDLDPVATHPEIERRQLDDLRSIGLDWDGAVVRQSERFDRYHAAIDRLTAEGRTYPCYCTRQEVGMAATAPHDHLPEGAYPGTCRQLTGAQRAERETAGRRPSLRLDAGAAAVTVVDRRSGELTGTVDDFVLRRADRTPAYNLAVVVDDAAQGIEEVVRGDDLLPGTPRQVYLSRLLGLPVPAYAHVPLVLGPDGERLAKRHGTVTLAALAGRQVGAATVLGRLAASIGLAESGEAVTTDTLVDRFDADALPPTPWVTDPDTW